MTDVVKPGSMVRLQSWLLWAYVYPSPRNVNETKNVKEVFTTKSLGFVVATLGEGERSLSLVFFGNHLNGWLYSDRLQEVS